MERWTTAPAPPAPPGPRRRAGQPSFSSTLLDAICDAMDEQPGSARSVSADMDRAAAAAATTAKKQREALHCYYYYKPSLAASHREAPPGAAPADDCASRGYFSSSEVEYSLRRLRPIRTGSSCGTRPQSSEKQRPEETARRARKMPSAHAAAVRGCSRPASPGARIASLLAAIFAGRRPSARQHPVAPEEVPACSTASSCARPGFPSITPPPARSLVSRRRTVRFLDIDGEVAVAAAAMGCTHVPVVEVEEVVAHRPAGAGVRPGSDGGEESSDASSDLFELDNLASIAPASARTCGDELPVYGTTGVGLRRDIGRRRRPFGYGGGFSRSYSRVV